MWFFIQLFPTHLVFKSPAYLFTKFQSSDHSKNAKAELKYSLVAQAPWLVSTKIFTVPIFVVFAIFVSRYCTIFYFLYFRYQICAHFENKYTLNVIKKFRTVAFCDCSIRMFTYLIPLHTFCVLCFRPNLFYYNFLLT